MRIYNFALYLKLKRLKNIDILAIFIQIKPDAATSLWLSKRLSEGGISNV
jgi:hypothetical protein